MTDKTTRELRHFAHDASGGVTDFFATEDEAIEFAKEGVQTATETANDDGEWAEGSDQIYVGIVTHRAFLNECEGGTWEMSFGPIPSPAPAAPSAAQGWMPIETAPKDRLLLLACADWAHSTILGKPVPVKIGGWNGSGRWEIFGASWKPTHWMEVPEFAAPGAQPAQDVTETAKRIAPVISEMVEVATSDDDGDACPEWLASNRATVDRWQCAIRDAFSPHDPYDMAAALRSGEVR